MIKIISEDGDVTTDEILEYLLQDYKHFKRYNFQEQNELTLFLNKDLTNNISFSNVFHRRGRINTISKTQQKSIYYSYIKKEEDPVIKAIEYISKQEGKNYVGEYNAEEQHNKIVDLYLAQKVGLKIPKTIVTNKKNDIITFYKECKEKVLTKCIKRSLYLMVKNVQILGKHSFLINESNINSLAKISALGIYQEYIEKLYEVRVFIYKDLIFSMAIFSQQNDKTKIDYRNYDDEDPNRYVPYKLPIHIERKIFSFFKRKKINTGSLDLIVNTVGEFIFLENNPQGQLDWLSKNCNYYIEKIIANDLILNDEKE